MAREAQEKITNKPARLFHTLQTDKTTTSEDQLVPNINEKERIGLF